MLEVDDDNKKEEKKIQVKTKVPEIIKTINAEGQKAYDLMDAEDEQQIIKAELFDETIKSFVYQQKGGELTLSITGILEAARRYKNIEAGVRKIEKTEEGWLAFAFAKNIKDNISCELAVLQPFKSMINGNLQSDPFSLQKAQSKALRNCIRKVIPANYFQSMIKIYLKNNAKKIGEKDGSKKTI